MKLPEEVIENVFTLAPPVVPGVYFLFNKSMEPVYIGSSHDCHGRIRSHIKSVRSAFTYGSFIVCEDARIRTAMEVEWIKTLKPKFNLIHNPNWEHELYTAMNYLSYNGRNDELPVRGSVSWHQVSEVLKEMGIKPKTRLIKSCEREHEQSK